MNKLLISAGAVAALALTSAPAAATPVSASASVHAHVYRPLTITNNTGLDFATIVLSGTGTYTDTISVDTTGALTCGTDVTCSGTPAAATFTLTGTKNSTAAITLPTTATLTGANNGGSLTVNITGPATVALGTTGNTGTQFGVGGSISVSNTTPDDLYSGSFTVDADYQ